MLLIIAAGVIVAVIEFLVMSIVVNRATIIGFQNGLIAGGGVLVVVVVVLWAATAILRPKGAAEGEQGKSAQPAPPPTEDSGQY